MIQKHKNLMEILDRNGIEIFHTTSFTAFHVIELYFIIAVPQTIKNEVNKK